MLFLSIPSWRITGAKAALMLALCACQSAPEAADIAVLECRSTHSAQAIINGQLTGHTSFGEVGSLFGVGVHGQIALGGGLCSATLIAPDVIVTAAHCVTGFPAHRLRVSTHPCPRPTDHEVLADVRFVAMHPDWRGDAPENDSPLRVEPTAAQQFRLHCEQRVGLEDAVQFWACMQQMQPDHFARAGFIDAHTGDLAIAILDRPLQRTPLARLPLPAEEERLVHLGAKLTAVGFGVSARSPDARVHQGDRYAGRVGIEELGFEEMRVDFAAARICSGDSGGPLLHHTGETSVLLGVGVRVYPSHTMHAPLCNGPGVATRVATYAPWIRQTLADACQAGQRTPEMCQSHPI